MSKIRLETVASIHALLSFYRKQGTNKAVNDSPSPEGNQKVVWSSALAAMGTAQLRNAEDVSPQPHRSEIANMLGFVRKQLWATPLQ